MTRLPRRIVLAGLGAAALAGCSATPPPTLYTLAAVPGVAIARPLPPATVRTVEIPKYLDRPQIVRRRTQYVVTEADFERWAEGFDEMLTRVLLDDLTLRLPGAALATNGSTVAPRTGTEIAVAIARFDPDPDGTVVLDARWTIDRGDDSGGQVRLERITRPAAAGTAGLVAAMSDCLGVLADHIATALAA